MVSIDRHPEVPNFLGLGQLKPEQLAELWPRRTPLSRDAIDEAITAWIAVTAPDPRALPFLTKRIKALPFLAGALERQLEEFPDPTSGLSRTERQVLAAVARGEATAGALVPPSRRSTRATRSPTSSCCGPCTSSAGAATSTAPPTARPARRPSSRSTSPITALGREALAGAIDRVHECGIDDWRGGVRLTGKGPVWRWDGARAQADREVTRAWGPPAAIASRG